MTFTTKPSYDFKSRPTKDVPAQPMPCGSYLVLVFGFGVGRVGSIGELGISGLSCFIFERLFHVNPSTFIKHKVY